MKNGYEVCGYCGKEFKKADIWDTDESTKVCTDCLVKKYGTAVTYKMLSGREDITMRRTPQELALD